MVVGRVVVVGLGVVVVVVVVVVVGAGVLVIMGNKSSCKQTKISSYHHDFFFSKN